MCGRTRKGEAAQRPLYEKPSGGFKGKKNDYSLWRWVFWDGHPVSATVILYDRPTAILIVFVKIFLDSPEISRLTDRMDRNLLNYAHRTHGRV